MIPKGSTILYKEITFFGKYKWIIIGGILFILLQTFFIISLVYFYRRQRFATVRLEETENKFRGLVYENRILSLNQMTASLSHELNQPLTAILSTAQAGIRFLDSGNADTALLKEIFQNIVEVDKRTAAILSSIRGMMKLEKREKEKVNLNSLIEEMTNIYKIEATGHQIKLNLRVTESPVYVMADLVLIKQVILNFLSNAVQSMDKIKSDLKIIDLTETVENDQVIVSVRDFGVGINDTVKEKLFKPFVTSRKEGLGIGLAISRTIIDDHHGRIWAENIPDGGAAFLFSLKILPDE